jgi:hypothetical protein
MVDHSIAALVAVRAAIKELETALSNPAIEKNGDAVVCIAL